jgi:PAS domain-containing protein
MTVKDAPDSREVEIKIAELLEAFPFYVMLVDEEHRILQANNAVRDALGIDSKAIVGKYCPLAVHGLSQPIGNCPLEEAVITNQAVERENLTRHQGAGFAHVYIRLSSYHLRDVPEHM